MLHINQSRILELAKKVNLSNLTLQQIAIRSGIGKASNQLISFHIEKLKKKGFLNPDGRVAEKNSGLIAIPYYGMANAGPATFLAEDNIQGYIKVSKSLFVGQRTNIFSIKTSGNSMNKEKIDGRVINDGDYLIAEKIYFPKNGDVVVTVAEGLVNIKKYKKIDNNTIALISNSTEDYPPIFLTPEDNPYIVGKIIKVLGNTEIS